MVSDPSPYQIDVLVIPQFCHFVFVMSGFSVRGDGGHAGRRGGIREKMLEYLPSKDIRQNHSFVVRVLRGARLIQVTIKISILGKLLC